MDVTNTVLWLTSDRARYVTGVTLPVDAGSESCDPMSIEDRVGRESNSMLLCMLERRRPLLV